MKLNVVSSFWAETMNDFSHNFFIDSSLTVFSQTSFKPDSYLKGQLLRNLHQFNYCGLKVIGCFGKILQVDGDRVFLALLDNFPERSYPLSQYD
jgi:hypothetical protein